MDRVWITNGSTSIPPVVNPLIAACHDGYVPTDVHVLNNPIIDDITDAATSLMKTVVTAQGGEEPSITVETIDEETDFEAITAYLQSAIGPVMMRTPTSLLIFRRGGGFGRLSASRPASDTMSITSIIRTSKPRRTSGRRIRRFHGRRSISSTSRR